MVPFIWAIGDSWRDGPLQVSDTHRCDFGTQCPLRKIECERMQKHGYVVAVQVLRCDAVLVRELDKPSEVTINKMNRTNMLVYCANHHHN